MIDKRLYCETFSRLCASEEAKKEVFQRMNQMNQKKNQKLPGLLRGAAIAAAMTMALAVTAGAVNLATGGELLQTLRQVWTDGYETRYEGVTPDGTPLEISIFEGSTIYTAEDGRLILQTAGEEVDITDDLASSGEARLVKSMDQRTVEVIVTGTAENWTLEETVTEADGSVSSRFQCTSDELQGGGIRISRSAIAEEGQEDGMVSSSVITVTDNGEDGITVTAESGASAQYYDWASDASAPATAVPKP